MLEKLIPFLIAAALGFAIGLERERRDFKLRSMGVRTFILLGLLGALAKFLDNPFLAAALMLFAATGIITGYIRTTTLSQGEQQTDFGLTTEIAAGATFVLGYLAHSDPLLSAMLALLIFIVLLSRTALHQFSREKITPRELQAAVILFVLALGILPLLPNEAIDPWGLVNIKKFVTIITVIAAVQFISYIAVRIFNESVGLPLSGILGGLVSSTAVLLTLPGLVKSNPRLLLPTTSAALMASASTLVFLLFVVGVLSVPLLKLILPALVTPIIVAYIIAWLIARKSKKTVSIQNLKNPISILSALKLGLSLSVVIIVIGFAHRLLGAAGTQIASFITGLVEIHGVSVSTTMLYADGTLSANDAKNSILFATLASMLSKLAITWVLNHGRYAVYVSSTLVLMMTLMGLGWLAF